MEKMRNEPFNKSNGSIPLEDKVEDATYHAGKRIGQMATDLSNTTSEYVRNGRAYVKVNPLKGVGIAATAGLVLGSIMTMALRRSHV